MSIAQAWPSIQSLLRQATDFSFASIRPDGSPHVTPIGSLLLKTHCKGLFIEKFTTTLPKNLEHDSRVCVYASSFSWPAFSRAMIVGRSEMPMGVRLYGRVGPRRPLTHEEHAAFLKKVRWAKWTKGYEALWGDLTHARDITFDHYEPVRAGAFTRGHWQQPEPNKRDLAAARAIGLQLATHPEVAPLLEGIDHFDMHVFEGDATLEEFIARMFTFPRWIRAFFRGHTLLAKILGLRTDDLGNMKLDPNALDLQPDKLVAFFRTSASEAGAFWVGGDDVDPHLSAWVAIIREPSGSGRGRFRVATIVHYKDWRGPLFMNAILPFHHLIVWAQGRRAAKSG